jgi:hypothetical protein
MKYKIDAIKIPGMLEKTKEIELPDGAIPLKVETILEHNINKNVTDVLVGLYADNILYYSDKEIRFNEDRSKMTINDVKGPISYNIFFRIRYLIPI